jgi:hypothetical protein
MLNTVCPRIPPNPRSSCTCIHTAIRPTRRTSQQRQKTIPACPSTIAQPLPARCPTLTPYNIFTHLHINTCLPGCPPTCQSLPTAASWAHVAARTTHSTRCTTPPRRACSSPKVCAMSTPLTQGLYPAAAEAETAGRWLLPPCSCSCLCAGPIGRLLEGY